MNGYVYELICPIKKEPFYVGSTTGELKVRLNTHISASKTKNNPVAKYIRDNNIKPEISILSYLAGGTKTDLRKSEQGWIKINVEMGYCLLNKNAAFSGACALVKHRPSVVNRIREHIKGTTMTIGRFYDEAAEEKLSKKKK